VLETYRQPAAQVATERHSPNLPPAVDSAAIPLSRYASSVLQVGVVLVTARPGEETPVSAVGRGHLRASHADREQVIGTLKAAFVQGMLTKDEFDLRVGQTFASRTYADMAALTADIPDGVAAARPSRTSAQAGVRVPGKAAKAATCVGLALALLAFAAFLGPGNYPERLIGLVVFFLPVCGLSTGGLLLLHSWLEKRSRGQLPQGPPSGTGTQGSQRAAPVTGPGSPPQIGQASPRTADAAQRRLPRARPAMI
jgi:DUF1707 SHOCT-like domain